MKKFLSILLAFLFYFSIFTSPLSAVYEPPSYSSNQSYSENPNLNINKRGYEKIQGVLNLIENFHPTIIDPKAPQFSSLLEGNPRPQVTSLYQVYNWINNQKANLWQRPPDLPQNLDFATLVGLKTIGGQGILVPDSGYDIGGGYEVTVVYAYPKGVVLRYGREDIVDTYHPYGYTVYIDNFIVNQELLSFYQQLTQNNRDELPILCNGYKLGTATGDEVRIAIVDSGSFMDPRWRDWWLNESPGVVSNCEISTTIVIKEEAVTIAGASNVCANQVKEETKDGGETEPPPVSESIYRALSVIGGFVDLSYIKFTDLESAQKRMTAGLKKLLPRKLNEEMVLPGTTTLKFTHFVQGEGENGEWDPNTRTPCNDAPQDEVDVPPHLWGKLAGSIRGLCGFLGAGICQPVGNYRFQLEETKFPCEIDDCSNGMEKQFQILYAKSNARLAEKNNFMIGGYVKQKITRFFNSFANKLVGKIINILRVQVLSRAELAGGHETSENARFLYGFFPNTVGEKVKPKDESKATKEGFRFGIGLSPVVEYETPGLFYELKKIINPYCIFQCGLKPSSVPNDKLCPSCDPNYYDQERPPRKKPDVLPPYCRWTADSYCTYGAWCNPNNEAGYNVNPAACGGPPQIEPGCDDGKDPVCEGCLGLPHGLAISKDVEWCGGKGGPRDCQAHPGSCKWVTQIDWENDLYDDPRFNGCYYSQSVCVQANPPASSAPNICQYACAPLCCGSQ